MAAFFLVPPYSHMLANLAGVQGKELAGLGGGGGNLIKQIL